MPVDTTNRPQMRWVPVTDHSGRTRMEAVWLSPDQVVAPVVAEVAVQATPAAVEVATAAVPAELHAHAVTHAA
ncbi:hypothetical protein [Nocardioides sp.]|uniref:hypothetical protein n=1 Tax=Nocardioides sp. TaxID=35761 RepID=UPI002B273B92|nr:hypothetical protein [Nocardioides sp.]